MVKYSKRLACSNETFDLYMEECKTKFLKHNPQFKGIKITQEFILRRVALSYLDKL